jgi:hypothetical protein
VGSAKLNDDDDDCVGVAVAVDDRLVADADAVADVVTGAIGPLISKSSTSRCSRAPRFADAGAVDAGGTGFDRCFDDDAVGVAAAAGAADTRAALADCGVVVVGVCADFLDGIGRAFVCC